MAAQLSTFYLFSKLSLELRRIIWEHALAAGKIIPVSYTERHLQVTSNTTSITIGRVNHEARTEAKKYMFPLLQSPYNNLLSGRYITSNLERDVLWLDGNRAAFLCLLRWLSSLRSRKSEATTPRLRVAISWRVIACLIIDFESEAKQEMAELMRYCNKAGVAEVLMIFDGESHQLGSNALASDAVFYPAFRPPRTFSYWRRTKASATSANFSLWPNMCNKLYLKDGHYQSDRSRSFRLGQTWASDCEAIEGGIQSFFEAVQLDRCQRVKEIKARGLNDDELKVDLIDQGLVEDEKLCAPQFKLRRILSGSAEMALVKSGRIMDLEATFGKE